MGGGGGQNSQSSPNGFSPLQYQVNNYMHNQQHINSDLAVKGFRNTDLSPYNSKFTVLRFSQSRSNNSSHYSNGQMAPLRPFEITPEDHDENLSSENVQMHNCGAAEAAPPEAAAHEVSAFDLGMSTTSIMSNNAGLGPQNQFISDKVPYQLRYTKPLSENLNLVEQENIFGGDAGSSDFFRLQKPPFGGFDQDSVIVPKTKRR